MDKVDSKKEIITEIEPEEINLKSFENKPSLNEKIWINDKINSRVRLKLLDIADSFFNTLDIDWVEVKDIIFTGSLANYNWSKYSDIDLHILIDFNDVDENKTLVKNYLDSKKNEWNKTHDNIKIYGYPIELYVQDISEENASTGVFSLEKNEWLIIPKNTPIGFDKNLIKKEASKLINKIDMLESKINSTNDEHKLSQLGNEVKSIYDKIKKMRKEGLNREGEKAYENIVFKILRRTNYIEKLILLKNKTFDILNSIR